MEKTLTLRLEDDRVVMDSGDLNLVEIWGLLEYASLQTRLRFIDGRHEIHEPEASPEPEAP